MQNSSKSACLLQRFAVCTVCTNTTLFPAECAQHLTAVRLKQHIARGRHCAKCLSRRGIDRFQHVAPNKLRVIFGQFFPILERDFLSLTPNRDSQRTHAVICGGRRGLFRCAAVSQYVQSEQNQKPCNHNGAPHVHCRIISEQCKHLLKAAVYIVPTFCNSVKTRAKKVDFPRRLWYNNRS